MAPVRETTAHSKGIGAPDSYLSIFYLHKPHSIFNLTAGPSKNN